MIANIFTELQTIATAFISFLVNIFTAVVDIIWTAGTDGGSGSFTIVGQLMLMGLATGLVMWALYFIRSLIRVRRG